MMNKVVNYILIAVIVAVFAYFQVKSKQQNTQIIQLKTELTKQYQNGIDSLGFELRMIKLDYLNAQKKIDSIHIIDSIQTLRLNYYRYKLRQYEKKTDINTINAMARDSIKRLLTE